MAEDHSKSIPAGTGILEQRKHHKRYLQYGTAGQAPVIPNDEFAKLWNAGQQVNAVTTNYIPTGSSWTATPDDYAFEILFAFTVRELDTILINNNNTVVYVHETGKMYRAVDNKAADTLHTFLISGYSQPGVKIKIARAWEEVTVDPVTKHIYKIQEILNPSTPALEIKLDHEQEEKYLEFEKSLILSNTPGRLDKPNPNREKQLEQTENDIVKYKDSGQQDPLGSCISPVTGYIN